MSIRRDADDPLAHKVYRCFDSHGVLLYIGCTRDLSYRMTLHNPIVMREMFDLTTEDYPNRVTARAAERAAIEAEVPLLNKHHNPKRFRAIARGGFVPVEPIHPLTAELVRQSEPVTMEQKRAAMKALGDYLGLDKFVRRSA